MRKLKTSTFVTLDGVMQAPGGPDEDTSNGFAFGGWQAPLWSDEAGAFVGEAMAEPFDLLLGRKTYDIFASYWPHQEGPIAEPFNKAVKYVASRQSQKLEWANAQQIEGDVVDGIKAIKNSKGPDLLMFGSANLIQTLLGAGLIDEMRVLTYPIVIGSGKKLFGPGTPAQTLRPLKTSVDSKGVVLAVYEPAGPIETGTVSD